MISVSGLPTVIAICRTPFRPAHSTYFQLKPNVQLEKLKKNLKFPEGLSCKLDFF